jgi:phosphosulfolactate synthase (CoM biosynthesis protein A)
MDYKQEDTLKIISHLPKYLRESDKGNVFPLVMIKNDWDHTFENSYIVRYAKENTKSISSVNIKVEATGHTFEEAVFNMYLKINELSKEGKVRGKEWIEISKTIIDLHAKKQVK